MVSEWASCLDAFSAYLLPDIATQRCPRTGQLVHQRSVPQGPLVLLRTLLTFPRLRQIGANLSCATNLLLPERMDYIIIAGTNELVWRGQHMIAIFYYTSLLSLPVKTGISLYGVNKPSNCSVFLTAADICTLLFE